MLCNGYELAARNAFRADIENRKSGIVGMLRMQARVFHACDSRMFRALQAELSCYKFKVVEGGALIFRR